MHSGARLPRFRRASSTPPPFRFTLRDLKILELVAKHRFLRSTHIVGLLGESRQQILRRLQLLFHHGYLDRPRAQLDYYEASGSSPLVYGLARRGAGRLRRDLNVPFEKMDWSGRRTNVGRLFLEHVLLISDFMVSLELACRKSGRIRLVPPHQLSLPTKASEKKEPFKWSVTVASGRKLTVVPDHVFALEFTDNKRQIGCFLEADRGTMPIVRTNSSLSSFYRKLQAYEATWAGRVHHTRFGFERLRVLTVTTSVERAAHLREVCKELPRARGVFLFTDAASILSTAESLGHLWLTADEREQAKILD